MAGGGEEVGDLVAGGTKQGGMNQKLNATENFHSEPRKTF